MEDPSIRTHDPVFEQLLWFGGIIAVVCAIAIIVVIAMIKRDRRY